MKILRIISSGVEEGGAEKGIVAIQPFLEAKGYTVKILASDSRPDMPHFNDYTFKAPGEGIFGKLMYTCNLSAYFTLRRVLKEYQPDVVHLHTIGAASPIILFALRGYPTVATVHGPEGYTRDLLIWCLRKTDFKNGEYDFANLTPTGRLRYWYYRYINYPLYRLGFRNIDEFVTISTYISKVMEAQGNKSVYIPNGVKMLPFTPASAQKTDHSMLYAGRLEKFKGVEYLLYALGAVLALFPEAMLYIAGEGKEVVELVALAKELGVEKSVVFLGHLNSSRLVEWYSKVTVAMVPSIWPEVASRSGIEAMSAGRPVIGTNVGGSPDWLIDGKTGYLVPPKDAKAISDAVITLFSDQTALERMSVAAREKALEYDVALHAERISKVYERLAESHLKRKREIMRIFYVTDQLMDGASAAAVHVGEVCKSMHHLGHAVTLYAPKIQGQKGDSPVPAVWIPSPKKFLSIAYQPKLFFRLIWDIHRTRPDVLYVRRSLLLFVPSILGWMFRVPVVLEINGLVRQDATHIDPNPMSRFLLNFGIFHLIESITLRLASFHITIADGIKEYLMTHYRLPASKIAIVHNGVDTELFIPRNKKETRASLLLPEGFTVGYIGSFHTWQGLQHIIKAAKIVSEKRPNVQFVLAGKGCDDTFVTNFIRENHLGANVVYVPETSYTKLSLYKSALDVGICYPLLIRSGVTSPMKIYEYLSSGVAVVSADFPGIRDEFGSLLVYAKAESPNDLAAAIVSLIDDPARTASFAREGRTFIENGRSWKAVTKKICELLQKVIAERSAPHVGTLPVSIEEGDTRHQNA